MSRGAATVDAVQAFVGPGLAAAIVLGHLSREPGSGGALLLVGRAQSLPAP